MTIHAVLLRKLLDVKLSQFISTPLKLRLYGMAIEIRLLLLLLLLERFVLAQSVCYNGHFSRWTWVSWYQKVSVLDYIEDILR